MTIHEYVEPERFVAGTVGPPGQRTFFLQARNGSRVTSVALEKTQVAVLAEGIDELLDTLLRRSGGELPVPALAPVDDQDLAPLDAPIEEEFRVSALSLMWDDEIDRVVIEARSGDDEDDEDDDVLRAVLTGAAARAFAARAQTVVAAGRPPCPFCTLPLDPEGHICPRQNGYRRRG
jgi:uncharacterized repeat protein (TIGR03847 family)